MAPVVSVYIIYSSVKIRSFRLNIIRSTSKIFEALIFALEFYKMSEEQKSKKFVDVSLKNRNNVQEQYGWQGK